MDLSEWLPPETIRRLYDRFPTLTDDQIAMRAMEHPDYAQRFARLGAEIEEYREDWEWAPLYSPEDFPKPHVPEGTERAFTNLVAAALDDGTHDENGTQTSRRKPIPRTTLEDAVKMLTERAGRNEVSRETGLSKRLVDGLIADLDAGTGLGWNERDRLALPPGTRATRDGLILPERR